MLTLDAVELQLGGFSLRANWSLPAGGVTAVIGPSGGGKSTLLGLIAGFVPPARGRILWHGQDLTGLAPGARPVSILFQDHNLFAHLSVAQNVGLGLRADGRLSKEEQAAVAAVLARVGLAEMGGRKPASLSGGQQSRVALARVLLAGRPLVLMDEPFAALGPGQRHEMLALARAELGARDISLLLVTHDPAEARAADRVVLVADGVAEPPVAAAALFADPPAALRAYLGKTG
jgi:thiamine transport system ATP-binding protein